jgi:hypothetical protein
MTVYEKNACTHVKLQCRLPCFSGRVVPGPITRTCLTAKACRPDKGPSQ